MHTSRAEAGGGERLLSHSPGGECFVSLASRPEAGGECPVTPNSLSHSPPPARRRAGASVRLPPEGEAVGGCFSSFVSPPLLSHSPPPGGGRRVFPSFVSPPLLSHSPPPGGGRRVFPSFVSPPLLSHSPPPGGGRRVFLLPRRGRQLGVFPLPGGRGRQWGVFCSPQRGEAGVFCSPHSEKSGVSPAWRHRGRWRVFCLTRLLSHPPLFVSLAWRRVFLLPRGGGRWRVFCLTRPLSLVSLPTASAQWGVFSSPRGRGECATSPTFFFALDHHSKGSLHSQN